MPFERGTFAVTFFKLSKKLPDNFLELFSSKVAGTIDEVKDEPQIGWVSGRHLLENKIDEDTALFGNYLYLNMRIAERKIPAALLKALCSREELVFLQANKSPFVPLKVKQQIKSEQIAKHLNRMPPAITGIPLMIDLDKNMLFLGTNSTSQIDKFIAFFNETCKVEPLQITPGELLLEMFNATEVSLPAVNFSNHLDSEISPGRDFFTWLWYYSEQHGGRLVLPEEGEFDLIFEGPLTLTFSDEAQGSAETTIKKGGSPLRSAEAKAALSVGKKLKKAKITMAQDKDTWHAIFDVDRFSLSSVTLPEGSEMEFKANLAERAQFLNTLQQVIRGYFQKFVETVSDIKWPQTESKLKEWVENRDSC